MSSSTIKLSQMSSLIVANAASASNHKAMWILPEILLSQGELHELS
jgi:hypothetical protein